MKKSTANHMHRKRRKNNLTWLFALLGILVLFLGTILAFLIFSNLSSKPTETVQEVSAVNVEKDIPETDMGDLIYHEPAAENVVMQGGFGYVNNELLVTLDSSDSLSALKDYLRTIGGEVVGEIPVTADYQILLPAAHTQGELEQMIEQLKALPYVRRSSLNYAFELENDAISGSSAYYPNDKKWDDWSGNSGNNWNMKAIDAPGAWVYRNQMQPVNVGVIDGIFYPYHEDLKDVFQEMPLGNASAMMNQGLSIWKGKWSGKGHATHVSGIIGADFDNGKGICGVAPNAKLYGVDWSDSPLYRTIDKKKPTFGDGIPDASIYSTVPYGNGYDGLVGTSMACPHVAGVAAMIFGIDPTFTAKEVKDIIISTATGSYGSVKEQYPLLNARLAVEKAIKLSNEKAKGQTGDDLPFEPSGEHQYRIFYDALTWEEAKAACEAKGGHLATITSEEEQQKLNLYNAGNHKLWIGGYKNTEGQWCWVTGEPWEYENWGDGEPNNSSNVVAGESCVAMWPEKWNDLANSNVYEQSGYICEWEASDVAEETQVEGYTGHLYEFYTLPESEWESGPITWQQAERRCEWKGGHLAVIESSTENFLLYSAMKAKGYENAYFGYSDKSSEGNWKWVNGTSTAYTNWHSGEPNNQDGIEHYAMFYENFQDGTWNDADGIIDAGCAYICEWDDPTDKISQGDSFTDQQLRIIAKDLGVPDDLNVEIRQSPKAYWESAGLWDIYVEITHNGKLVASGSFDVETGEMGRNIYIYTPV